MDNDLSIIKYLPEEAAPERLKKKILNRIMIIKLKPLIYAVTASLIINLGFLSNHVYSRIAETEALTIIKVMLQDFEMSFDYLANIFSGLKEIIPLFSSSLLAVNLILILFLMGMFKRYSSELLKY